MKFLADMGISPKTVVFLRERGCDAVHLTELGLRRLHHEDVLELARAHDRILLTHDLDLARIVACRSAESPSVVIFRLSDMRPTNVNRHLSALIDLYGEALRRGAILSVTSRRVRITRLPVEK